jgi:hypothetical protein
LRRHLRFGPLVALAAALVLVGGGRAQAQVPTSLSVYLSRPQSQTTVFTGTVTETFESLATGNRTTNFSSSIGTYQLGASNPFNIQNDNQYGSGTGRYMAFGAQSGTSAPITLLFSAPQAYFGFSWNAGDQWNGMTFYSGATMIGRFSTATLTSLLSQPTVRAIDNTIYNSSEYYGKPNNTTQNASEPYAFVNFIATGGTFTRIVFDNSGQTGTGFESDNHTIRAASPTPDSSFVYVTAVATAPEPVSASLLLLGSVPLLALRRRSARRAAV